MPKKKVERKSEEPKIIKEIDKMAMDIVKMRGNPLLVMYYDDQHGSIEEEDIDEIYDEYRKRGLDGTVPIEKLDILIHTYGGDPYPPYLIIQTIREFAKKLNMLIPHYAYSAGTLICLGGDKIHFGTYGRLSAMDIRVGDIELLSIDNYIEFTEYSMSVITESLLEIMQSRGGKGVTGEFTTDVAEELLVKMVEQFGALKIGELFRKRSLTAHYAKILLEDYMLKHLPEDLKKNTIDNIITFFVYKSPSHNINIDYHLAKKFLLPVEKMDVELYDKTRKLISLLRDATEQGIICKYMGQSPKHEWGYRQPFFRLYLGGSNNG